MILGPRCDAMLANHCQCPNVQEENSTFCKLHNAKIVSTPAQVAKTLNLLHKEHKAPLSNNS